MSLWMRSVIRGTKQALDEICVRHSYRATYQPWRSSSGSIDTFSSIRGQQQACKVHPPAPLGQPHHLTHPHLLEEGQVNPGIFKEEFVLRRHRLAEKILASPSALKSKHRAPVLSGHERYQSHLVLVPAAKRSFMVDKIPYFFRQDTDFRYLTGCLEPDCLLVIQVDDSAESSTLFVRDPNPREEKWEGPRTRPGQDARDFFGVDKAVSIANFEQFLKQYRDDHREFLLWYDYLNPKSSEVHSLVMDFIRNLSSHQLIESPRSLIHELRVLKTPAEVALCRQSCRIASEAIAETMRQTKKQLTTEGQVFATVDYLCRLKGAQYLAYPPVVASGNNSNIIHYTHCNEELKDNELILMDAGCELHGYTSDITRTWPKSGRFTNAQRILYEIVLEVQLELIASLKDTDERPTIDGLYRKMQSTLSDLLVSEKILSEGMSELELSIKVSDLCPHHVSHFLGMDVHDTALISKTSPLQKGMVLTIEPGLYVSQSRTDVAPEFRGIGIRIEDDILVTEGGCDVLTSQCPKTVEEIEKLCDN